jgi:hypothetical protein
MESSTTFLVGLIVECCELSPTMMLVARVGPNVLDSGAARINREALWNMPYFNESVGTPNQVKHKLFCFALESLSVRGLFCR